MRLIQDSIAETVNKANKKYANKSALYLAGLRHRLRRIASGRCEKNGCGNISLPSIKICQVHRDKSKEYQKKRYIVLKEAKTAQKSK